MLIYIENPGNCIEEKLIEFNKIARYKISITNINCVPIHQQTKYLIKKIFV